MNSLVEEIPLPNGLVLEVWDYSRSIASNVVKVELLIRIRIEVQPSFFSRQEQFEKTREVCGSEIFYEYRKERAFVRDMDRKEVFADLLETFRRSSLPYLSHPLFSQRAALARYRDIEQHPYRYRRVSEEPVTESE